MNKKLFLMIVFIHLFFISFSQKTILEKGVLEHGHYFIVEQLDDSITLKSTFDSTGVLDGAQEYMNHSYFEYFHSITYYEIGHKKESIFLNENGMIYERTIYENDIVKEFWHFELNNENSYIVCKNFINYILFYRFKNGVLMDSKIDFNKKICNCSGF